MNHFLFSVALRHTGYSKSCSHSKMYKTEIYSFSSLRRYRDTECILQSFLSLRGCQAVFASVCYYRSSGMTDYCLALWILNGQVTYAQFHQCSETDKSGTPVPWVPPLKYHYCVAQLYISFSRENLQSWQSFWLCGCVSRRQAQERRKPHKYFYQL